MWAFAGVVMGQRKHEVTQTFSAFLQLMISFPSSFNSQVNNGDVELQRSQSSDIVICYTSATPFHVRLLRDFLVKSPM
ncbi:hypothetical protein J5N97_028502 [Dioscorea zingiberensis]|uniref:Uncharacterized protein n=1 Tax=Dioscorea zingiberensis TaxID=325984 RepID=A0A9D5BZ36_9LILI|nr:hypothetical protein J5N97_028502 [Dioscorea zingiberensis]